MVGEVYMLPINNLIKWAKGVEYPTYVIPLVELDREEIFEIRQYLLETGAATQATITNCPPQPLALELRLK